MEEINKEKKEVSEIRNKSRKIMGYSSRWPVIMASAFLLLSIAVFVTVVVVNLLSVPKPPKDQFILPDPLIKVEKREEIVLNKKTAPQIKNSVREKVSSLPSEEVVDFVPTFEDESPKNPEIKIKREVGAREFLSFIGIRPPSKIRSFMEDRFMFGFYTGDTDSPFLMFKIKSYDNAFAGMLEWENAIASDIKKIFILGAPLTDTPFTDIVINNRAARILLGQNEETILIYSFLDTTTLLIVTNSQTFNEIARRFALPR